MKPGKQLLIALVVGSCIGIFVTLGLESFSLPKAKPATIIKESWVGKIDMKTGDITLREE